LSGSNRAAEARKIDEKRDRGWDLTAERAGEAAAEACQRANTPYMVGPTTVTFPNQAINVTSAAQTVTIANTGSVPLPITNIAVGGANRNRFAQTNTCGANPFRPFPSSLAVGASCTVSTTFRPTAATSYAGTVTISVGCGATPAQTVVSLSGTGQ